MKYTLHICMEIARSQIILEMRENSYCLTKNNISKIFLTVYSTYLIDLTFTLKGVRRISRYHQRPKYVITHSMPSETRMFPPMWKGCTNAHCQTRQLFISSTYPGNDWSMLLLIKT